MTKHLSVASRPLSSPTSVSDDRRTPNTARSRRGVQIGIVVAVTCVVGLTAAIFLPLQMAIAAALGIFCVGMWATAAIPEYWPALAFFAVAIMLQIAPAETVLSGFSSSTWWLLFGGMVVGSSIRHTGLGKRAGTHLSGVLGKRYSTVISGITLFSMALAFVMPSSMGRIVLLVPIAVSLAEHMGYDSNSNGRIGMLMAAALGTCLPAYAILPANTPNMVLAGAAESLYGLRIGYWDYLVLHFPVLGIGKAAVLVLVILWMFPDRDPTLATGLEEKRSPMGSGERRLVVVLGLCLALWLTDGIHHVSPGWIGLAAALYCLWPGSNLTSAKCINEEINYAILFFVAGILGLGAVISSTGLGTAIVSALSMHAQFAADRPVWNIAALTVLSTAVSIVTNQPGVPAVMTPGAQDLVVATGLPLTTVLMTQVLAFSNVFLPYQAPPLVTASQLGHLPTGAVTRLCLILFATSALILIPLDLLWWHFLGMF